ncbi:MAG: hypothetical protein ACJ708_05120 [Nitrososphaeraceae archaeon]
MSLYDVDSLSNTPSLSTAVLNAVISLSNQSGLMIVDNKCTNDTKRAGRKEDNRCCTQENSSPV